MIKIGDLVFMSAKGRGMYSHESSNPHDQVGVVDEVEMWGYESYWVMWQNNRHNAYRTGQLLVVNNSELIQQIKPGRIEVSILRGLEYA